MSLLTGHRSTPAAPTARCAAPLALLLFLTAALSGCGGPEDGPVTPAATEEEIEAHEAAIRAAENAPPGTVEGP